MVTARMCRSNWETKFPTVTSSGAPDSNSTHPEEWEGIYLRKPSQKPRRRQTLSTMPSMNTLTSCSPLKKTKTKHYLYCWKGLEGGRGYRGRRVLSGTTGEQAVGLDWWYLPAPYLGNTFVMGAASSYSRKRLVHLAAWKKHTEGDILKSRALGGVGGTEM